MAEREVAFTWATVAIVLYELSAALDDEREAA